MTIIGIGWIPGKRVFSAARGLMRTPAGCAPGGLGRKEVKPIGATHPGQRSNRPHQQAGHVAAIEQTRRRYQPVQTGAVHAWLPLREETTLEFQLIPL